MNRKFAIDGVDAGTPLAVAAPAMLLSKSKPLFALEEAAASGADMDAVHDMRVASRRLRETMVLLRPLYPRREFKTWYRRVRGITRALGPVRDADVFIDAWSGMLGELGDEGRCCVAFLVGHRMGRRTHELSALNDHLAHLDLRSGKKEFAGFARAVQPGDSGRTPLSEFAHSAVSQRAAVVFGAQEAALPEERVTEQHALRIDYKKLRYAVEAFAPCYAERFDPLYETLTAFQDALGDLHDIHVFLDVLHDQEIVSRAHHAGVSDAGMTEVEALLDRRAHGRWEEFASLAGEHPPEALLPDLLLPLARTSETVVSSPAWIVEPVEEVSGPWPFAVTGAPIVGPVTIGDEPWEHSGLITPNGTDVTDVNPAVSGAPE